MRIAIVMYGQLRWHEFANQTFITNFYPVLKDHDVQYFCHFWDSSPDLEYNKSADNPNSLTDFKELYRPAVISRSNPVSLNEIKSQFNNTIDKMSDNLLNQIYSLNLAFEVLDREQIATRKKFDLYIKMRPDLAFMNPVSLDGIDSNSVYVCKTERPLNEYATDLLLITKKYDHFRTVCKMGFSFDQILGRLLAKENRGLFYHEEVLANHLVHNQVPIKAHSSIIDLARHHK